MAIFFALVALFIMIKQPRIHKLKPNEVPENPRIKLAHSWQFLSLIKELFAYNLNLVHQNLPIVPIYFLTPLDN